MISSSSAPQPHTKAQILEPFTLPGSCQVITYQIAATHVGVSPLFFFSKILSEKNIRLLLCVSLLFAYHMRGQVRSLQLNN